MKMIHLPLVAAVLGASTIGVPTAQAQVLCEREMTAKLEELRVDRSTVTNLYANNVRTIEGGSAGITGWVSLNSCRGKIVFNMGSTCRIFETYTMGECRVQGVSSY